MWKEELVRAIFAAIGPLEVPYSRRRSAGYGKVFINRYTSQRRWCAMIGKYGRDNVANHPEGFTVYLALVYDSMSERNVLEREEYELGGIVISSELIQFIGSYADGYKCVSLAQPDGIEVIAQAMAEAAYKLIKGKYAQPFGYPPSGIV